MAAVRAVPVVHVNCPKCQSLMALVAYKRVLTRCCFCPRCQHVWDTAVPRAKPNSPPAPRTHR